MSFIFCLIYAFFTFICSSIVCISLLLFSNWYNDVDEAQKKRNVNSKKSKQFPTYWRKFVALLFKIQLGEQNKFHSFEFFFLWDYIRDKRRRKKKHTLLYFFTVFFFKWIRIKIMFERSSMNFNELTSIAEDAWAKHMGKIHLFDPYWFF